MLMAPNNVLMPFLMSMLLGRTIDLRTYEVGGDAFDDTYIDEKIINQTNSTYTVLQDNMLPYSIMGLPVDIALRIKTGLLRSYSGRMGLDGVLRHSTWQEKSAVVAVGTVVQTVERTLKKDAKPLPNWTTRISKSQTHYTRSLMYGGWSVVLYQFKCDIPGDVEIVKRTLTDILGVFGSVNQKTIKLWRKAVLAIHANQEIRGQVRIHAHSYATFPFHLNVSSPSGLVHAINEMPKLVGPMGKPLFIELMPLHELDPSYPAVTENHTLDRELEQINEMYNDVKNTKNSINHWIKETDVIFSEDEEITISRLTDHLSACIKLIRQVANEASVYRNMNQTLMDSAFNLYNSHLTHFTVSYDRIFRRLKEDIDAGCENEFLHKIKGLLKVDDSERIEVGEVDGGLEECKEACLAVPMCRAIGYVDRLMILKKLKSISPSSYKLTLKHKLCYVYFRSSSTADVIPPLGASIAGVYDRKCL